MKTKILNGGDPVDFTVPSGGCVSGVGVLIGAIFLIPVTSNIAGDVAAGHASGVFDHVKEGAGSGQAWAFGDSVYWDAVNARLTKTASGNTKVGVAVAAAITTAVIGRFRINQPA